MKTSVTTHVKLETTCSELSKTSKIMRIGAIAKDLGASE